MFCPHGNGFPKGTHDVPWQCSGTVQFQGNPLEAASTQPAFKFGDRGTATRSPSLRKGRGMSECGTLEQHGADVEEDGTSGAASAMSPAGQGDLAETGLDSQPQPGHRPQGKRGQPSAEVWACHPLPRVGLRPSLVAETTSPKHGKF